MRPGLLFRFLPRPISNIPSAGNEARYSFVNCISSSASTRSLVTAKGYLLYQASALEIHHFTHTSASNPKFQSHLGSYSCMADANNPTEARSGLTWPAAHPARPTNHLDLGACVWLEEGFRLWGVSV